MKALQFLCAAACTLAFHFSIAQTAMPPDTAAVETSPSGEPDLDVQFIGDGNIQKSLSSGDEIPANTGIGVLVEKKFNDHPFCEAMEFELVFNIASTADSIKAKFENNRFTNAGDFGRYLLIPRSAKQGVYAFMKLYVKEPEKADKAWKRSLQLLIPNGAHFAVVGSNTTWTYDSIAYGASAMYARGGVFWEFLPKSCWCPPKVDDDRMSVTIGYNYGIRYLAGDVGQSINDAWRTTILGTNRKHFWASEVSLGMRIKNIRAEASYPFVFSQTNKIASIPGLTDGQLITSISFIGGFSIRLNK